MVASGGVGVCMAKGGMCGEGGHAWQRGGARYKIRPVIAWAVCILLECILVPLLFLHKTYLGIDWIKR